MTPQVQPAPPEQLAPEDSSQPSPAQQLAVLVHAWPGCPQLAPGWQAPTVAPPGIAQVSPMQQSPEEVHAPLCGSHAGWALHTPPTQ